MLLVELVSGDASLETKNPGRDVTTNIIGPMQFRVLVYVGVAFCAISAAPVSMFGKSGKPWQS